MLVAVVEVVDDVVVGDDVPRDQRCAPMRVTVMVASCCVELERTADDAVRERPSGVVARSRRSVNSMPGIETTRSVSSTNRQPSTPGIQSALVKSPTMAHTSSAGRSIEVSARASATEVTAALLRWSCHEPPSLAPSAIVTGHCATTARREQELHRRRAAPSSTTRHQRPCPALHVTARWLTRRPRQTLTRPICVQ